MSKFLEMVESGVLCEDCGSYIEEENNRGYPVKCMDCKPKPKLKNKKKSKKKTLRAKI
jgi:hydrogenase maturation factor HypF (carbamoyltransferase family)